MIRTIRTWVRVVTLIAGAGFGSSSLAQVLPQGTAEAGAAQAAVCSACHGPNGNSLIPQNPSLAGQNATYLAKQLRLYKSGERDNPIMMPLAQALSDQDIQDLAVYYSEQTPTGLEADPSYWKAGQDLYRSGNKERQIPACISCHGPVGRGNVPAGYPALRAQQSVYTSKQLADYAAGARYAGQNPPTEHARMMMEIAARMSPEDIRNVASYIQGMR